MPPPKSKKLVSPYKYSCDNLFKILAKYQCIKLLESVSTSYNIPKDILLKERENIIKQIDELKINITYKKRKEYRKKDNSTDNLNNRCCARVYSPNNLISINEDNDKLIYGSRCARKITSQSTKYCKQHKYALTHGNFLEEPDTYIKKHFITDYIKKINKVKPMSKTVLTKRVLVVQKDL